MFSLRTNSVVTRRIGWLVASALCTLSVSHAQAQGSPDGPIDVSHVGLDLWIGVPERRVSGQAEITLVLLQPVDAIELDAVGLDVASVEWLGVGLRPFETTDRTLRIDLGAMREIGERIVLRIDYVAGASNPSDPSNIWGSVGQGLRFLAPTATDPRRRLQVWSSNTPGSAPRWFPGNDQLDDLRTFSLRATVADGLSVLSGGSQTLEQVNGDGTRTFEWALTTPHQNHRSSLVVGDFQAIISRSDGIVLINHGYPDEQDGVAASIERLPAMASYFRTLLGAEPPYGPYQQVFVQELPWGMSNPGLATLTENFVDSAEVHRDFLYLWDDLQAESLSEQWFGNSVAPATWEDHWIARGLPRYLATLFNEHANGEAEVLLSPYRVGGDLQTVLGEWNQGIREPVAPARVDDPVAFANSNRPYVRAGMVMRLLEGEIGRDVLMAGLRRFERDHRGSLATTADFERAVATAAGRDLTWFFDQWMRRGDHPVLAVAHRYDSAAGQIVIEVTQSVAGSDAASTPPPLFQGSLDIEIDGTIERVILLPQAVNTFVFPRRVAPDYVNIDHGSRWIADIRHPRSDGELEALAGHGADVLARRRAMITLADRVATPDADPELRTRVVDRFLEILEGDDYWRLKMTAIAQAQRVLNPSGSTPRAGLDARIEAALERVIRGTDRDEAWVRFAALNWLGQSEDRRHADLYLGLLRDPSDRIINAAATALGRTRDPRAFEALVALEPHPSWKNQSRISMLDGLGVLGDPRGVDHALRALQDNHGARWTLVTPVWDYRLAAAQALKRLEASNRGYPLLHAQLYEALNAGQVTDAIYTLHLMAALGDLRATEAIEAMRLRYAAEADVVAALIPIRAQFP